MAADEKDGGEAFPSTDVARVIGPTGMTVFQAYKAAALMGSALAEDIPADRIAERADQIAAAAVASDNARKS